MLDVSTDNSRAIGFYHKMGLEIVKRYVSDIEKIEFVCFETAATPLKEATAKSVCSSDSTEEEPVKSL